MVFGSLQCFTLPDCYFFKSTEPKMRRSAAPSQLLGQSAKKPRFIPPGKILQKTFEYVDPEMKTDEVILRGEDHKHINITNVNNS